MKKKRVEPFLVLGPILIGPVVPQVYTRMWQGHSSEDVKTVLECIAGHDELNGSFVDVCFIHKHQLLEMYDVEHMSMNGMCMYVINEGGRLCPYQLWPQFAKAYTDMPIRRMPEFVSLITNTLSVRVPEKLAYTEHDLAWRRCSCGEIEPRLPRVGLTYDALAYVRVRKESTSAIQFSKF